MVQAPLQEAPVPVAGTERLASPAVEGATAHTRAPSSSTTANLSSNHMSPMLEVQTIATALGALFVLASMHAVCSIRSMPAVWKTRLSARSSR